MCSDSMNHILGIDFGINSMSLRVTLRARCISDYNPLNIINRTGGFEKVRILLHSNQYEFVDRLIDINCLYI